MGPYVLVRLGGRERPLRYNIRNSRLATAGLQNAMPARADKLTIGDSAGLVFRQDQDAVLVFLWQGMVHADEKLTLQKVESWLDREVVEQGRPMSDFSLPILEALKQAHLIELNYRSTIGDDDTTAMAEEEPAEAPDPLASAPVRPLSQFARHGISTE